jgi:hypothetical protein
MKSVSGYEEAVEAIGEFEFDEFCLIERMSFQVVESTDRPVQELELQMRTDRRDPAARIRLRFLGVQKFKIDDWPGGEVQVTGFEIFDISDRQLEGLYWQIRDYEEDAISFFCREVEIMSVSHVDESSRPG